MEGLANFPPSRQQIPDFALAKTLINQEDYASIVLSAAHPSSRLPAFLHARLQIGPLLPRPEPPGHALLDLLVDRIELSQPQGCDKGTDQTRTWKVDALTKSATQHSKTNALAGGGELIQKTLSC